MIAIIREDLIRDDVLPGTPTMLKYKTQADKGSLITHLRVMEIYICGKVFKWLKKQGGLAAMKEHNEKKQRFCMITWIRARCSKELLYQKTVLL